MKKGGLGKGLESLFQETAGTSVATQGVTMLRLAEVEPDKEQPRKVFEDSALAELASSIMEHGVLQPIVVRPSPRGGYKIVAGERRWRASRPTPRRAWTRPSWAWALSRRRVCA